MSEVTYEAEVAALVEQVWMMVDGRRRLLVLKAVFVDWCGREASARELSDIKRQRGLFLMQEGLIEIDQEGSYWCKRAFSGARRAW